MAITNQINRGYLQRKVKTLGIESLSDQELLVLLLLPKQDVKRANQSATAIMTDVCSLRGLETCTLHELRNWLQEDYLQLAAPLELKRRLLTTRKLTLGQMCSSKTAGQYLLSKMQSLQQEVLLGLYLNTKNEIIAEKEISRGTINSANGHPREIMHLAVKYAAAGFIIAHNHPSGDPTPSQSDIQMSQRLAQCGQLLGINLIDHLIIGDGKYLSLREYNVLPALKYAD